MTYHRNCLRHRWSIRMCVCVGLILLGSMCFVPTATAQVKFSVATIHPSAAEVKFEHDGRTEILPDGLHMQDVLLTTVYQVGVWGAGHAQISGPGLLQSTRYDILARVDKPVGLDEMKLMMRALLAERFKLSFHHENRELRSYAMVVAKGGHKLREAAGDGKSSRENTANSTIAKSMTMREFADFLSGPAATAAMVVDKMPQGPDRASTILCWTLLRTFRRTGRRWGRTTYEYFDGGFAG